MKAESFAAGAEAQRLFSFQFSAFSFPRRTACQAAGVGLLEVSLGTRTVAVVELGRISSGDGFICRRFTRARPWCYSLADYL